MISSRSNSAKLPRMFTIRFDIGPDSGVSGNKLSESDSVLHQGATFHRVKTRTAPPRMEGVGFRPPVEGQTEGVLLERPKDF